MSVVSTVCITSILTLIVFSCHSLHESKQHARTLLRGDRWYTSDRPQISITGNENPSRFHGFQEVRSFFEKYNARNNWQSLKELRLVIIGDQGGHKHQATKQYNATAISIEQRHKRNPYHAMFTTGDNVYPDGITTAEYHIMDRLTKEVFCGRASPPLARGEVLKNIPWFFVEGNHDHCKQPYAQVAYAKERMPDTESADGVNHPVVILPDLFYGIGFEFGNKRISFTMLDSMINRAQHESYSGCSHPQNTEGRKQYYRNVRKAQQTQWMQQHLRDNTTNDDYRVLLLHHGPFSTWKWRGCDHTKQLLDDMQPIGLIGGRELLEGRHVFDLVAAGHDHAFEYGYVSNPLIRNAVIGGTRSCESNNIFADIFTGRMRKRYRHSNIPKYQEYDANVKRGGREAWKGCEGGGFVELIFKDIEGQQELKATIIYFSGTGNELFRKDISRMVMPEIPVLR